MNEIKTGDKAPGFTLPASGGKTVSLSDYAGKAVVLYFYPKDDTSGCTAQACGFRDSIAQFNGLDAVVIGVSRDSVASHEKFIKKHDLNFILVSDEAGALCQAYGVWTEKSMYGRKYMGIERSTFLIDAQGQIAALWRNVKVPGHVKAVAEALEALSKQEAA